MQLAMTMVMSMLLVIDSLRDTNMHVRVLEGKAQSNGHMLRSNLSGTFSPIRILALLLRQGIQSSEPSWQAPLWFIELASDEYESNPNHAQSFPVTDF
eukprot:1652022-Amphidinium_carterae.1